MSNALPPMTKWFLRWPLFVFVASGVAGGLYTWWDLHGAGLISQSFWLLPGTAIVLAVGLGLWARRVVWRKHRTTGLTAGIAALCLVLGLVLFGGAASTALVLERFFHAVPERDIAAMETWLLDRFADVRLPADLQKPENNALLTIKNLNLLGKLSEQERTRLSQLAKDGVKAATAAEANRLLLKLGLTRDDFARVTEIPIGGWNGLNQVITARQARGNYGTGLDNIAVFSLAAVVWADLELLERRLETSFPLLLWLAALEDPVTALPDLSVYALGQNAALDRINALLLQDRLNSRHISAAYKTISPLATTPETYWTTTHRQMNGLVRLLHYFNERKNLHGTSTLDWNIFQAITLKATVQFAYDGSLQDRFWRTQQTLWPDVPAPQRGSAAPVITAMNAGFQGFSNTLDATSDAQEDRFLKFLFLRRSISRYLAALALQVDAAANKRPDIAATIDLVAENPRDPWTSQFIILSADENKIAEFRLPALDAPESVDRSAAPLYRIGTTPQGEMVFVWNSALFYDDALRRQAGVANVKTVSVPPE